MKQLLWLLLFLYVYAIYSAYVRYRDPCAPRRILPPEGEKVEDVRLSRPLAFLLALVWWWPLVLIFGISLYDLASSVWRKVTA